MTDVPLALEMIDDVLTITKCSLTSVTMSAKVNAFIENKKLQLSQEMCSVIHVGNLKKRKVKATLNLIFMATKCIRQTQLNTWER